MVILFRVSKLLTKHWNCDEQESLRPQKNILLPAEYSCIAGLTRNEADFISPGRFNLYKIFFKKIETR
jgi:hypothetical protein